ncbi:enoyl-CoA hydratase/isomerase family protein [Caballeronia concitans]|uniref:Short chain enoyl-CoA hydratase n=1 Tax=Caballeronia concitans TaxID=1777133 RepID=A0A658QUT4_9BURK|nr:enoyl-CoA hydratase/isomerase family protein [Caballeronia concitans]KIG08757.1 Enoyl-CoA hydratase/isomerase [Burkholderia sp. MR1]SAL24011.1 short chain enoyl-CoA hydratase [Caballeronia concitans]
MNDDDKNKQGEVRLTMEGAAAHIVFDRADAHNAMTWHMYEQLEAICERLANERDVRVATFRGAGGKAFVAGTDIQQFTAFKSAEDGVNYERRIERVLSKVDALPMPTLAIVDGWCVGGGLAIAACCDLRIATPQAKFGVPIARTLGNCLAISNTARIVAEFGIGRAKRMLVLGDMLNVDDAIAAGFVIESVEPDQLDARAAALVDRLSRNAPITMRVSKQSMSRMLAALPLEGDDLVRQCYGSHDFHEGVAAFTEKRPPVWTGA